MKESLKFKKGEEIPEPEGGWKVGMKARLECFATVRDDRANKIHRAAPGTIGEIKQIGGSVHDLRMECTAQDGTVINVWLSFNEILPLRTIEETEAARTNAWLSHDEVEPIKEEKEEEEMEENSPHPKAA